MNRRLLTILLVAFLIAIGCTMLVVRLVRNQAAAARPPATASVVAAKTDIKLGTILNADNLTTVEVVGVAPQGTIPEKNKSIAIGRGVISDRRRIGSHHPPGHEGVRRQGRRRGERVGIRYARNARGCSYLRHASG